MYLIIFLIKKKKNKRKSDHSTLQNFVKMFIGLAYLSRSRKFDRVSHKIFYLSRRIRSLIQVLDDNTDIINHNCNQDFVGKKTLMFLCELLKK